MLQAFKFYINPIRFYKENPYLLQKWSKKINSKYKYRCCKCGVMKDKQNHDAHHILPKFLHPKLVYSYRNGVLLCKQCHKEYHSLYKLKEVNRETLEKFLGYTLS